MRTTTSESRYAADSPDNAPSRTGWEYAAGQIEAYREQWGMDAEQLDSGAARYGAQARHWQRVEQRIEEALRPRRAPDLSYGIDI